MVILFLHRHTYAYMYISKQRLVFQEKFIFICKFLVKIICYKDSTNNCLKMYACECWHRKPVSCVWAISYLGYVCVNVILFQCTDFNCF